MLSRCQLPLQHTRTQQIKSRLQLRQEKQQNPSEHQMNPNGGTFDDDAPHRVACHHAHFRIGRPDLRRRDKLHATHADIDPSGTLSKAALDERTL